MKEKGEQEAVAQGVNVCLSIGGLVVQFYSLHAEVSQGQDTEIFLL